MKRLGCILVCFVLLLGLLPIPAKAADLEVEAKSALLMDVATGTVLFAQNEHEGTCQRNQGHDHAAHHGGH